METRTHIIVPKFGDAGDIVITGSSRNQVASARNRVELIAESARQKEPFTHFLSIPVMTIRNKFLEFQSEVLEKCSEDRGIDKTIFQNPNKLHLTIGTMALMDDHDRKKGSELLTDYMKNIPALLEEQPLKITIQGIEYMNDDPAEVDVLYAKILPNESSKKLQLIADQLVDIFVSSGLMQRQYERVKLHVTIMNTMFRKDSTGVMETNFRQGKRSRECFNASTLLNLFQDYPFGDVQLENVQLSQRYGVNKDGYYYFVAKCAFPS